MQSKTQSLIEVVASTFVAFLISLALQHWVVSPLALKYGWLHSAHGSVMITTFFTVVSLVRSFYFRRFFNWLHHRSES